MGIVELLSRVLGKTSSTQIRKSRAYAEGYAAGVVRRQGQRLQPYAVIGSDEWDKGFRDGYFGQLILDSAQVAMAGISGSAQKHHRRLAR